MAAARIIKARALADFIDRHHPDLGDTIANNGQRVYEIGVVDRKSIEISALKAIGVDVTGRTIDDPTTQTYCSWATWTIAAALIHDRRSGPAVFTGQAPQRWRVRVDTGSGIDTDAVFALPERAREFALAAANQLEARGYEIGESDGGETYERITYRRDGEIDVTITREQVTS